MSFLLLVISLFGYVYSDYDCLCNYNVEKSVLPSPTAQAQPIGYLYEFDCKELLGDFSNSPTWAQVAFEHNIGYIEKDAQIASQVCPGDPPIDDKVVTTTASTTTLTSEKPTNAKTESTTASRQPTTTTIQSTILTTPTTITTTTTKPTTTTFSPPTTTASTTTTLKTTTITLSTKSPSTTSTTHSTTTINTSTSTSSLPSSTMTSPTTVTTGKLVCPLKIQQVALSEKSIAFVNDMNAKCYELVTFKRSWTFAEDDCQKKGGHLTSIQDAHEENLLLGHVQTYGSRTWIGLNDKRNEKQFEWSSGEAVMYQNWQAGHTDSIKHSTEDCVTMGTISGTWDDESCGNLYAYICKFDAVPDNGTHISRATYPTQTYSTMSPFITNVQTTTGISGHLQCPQTVLHTASNRGETLFVSQDSRKCYELVTRHKSWDNAETDCQTRGGHLATITNSREEQLLYHYVKSYGHTTWIGLNDQSHEEHFEWSSGVAATYYNWHPGRKDLYTHKYEDCVAMGSLLGTWEDQDCLYNYYAYLCEYDAVTGHQGSITNVDGNTQLCSSTVQHIAERDNGILGQFERGCYELIRSSYVSWQHGEDMCQSRGGHLAHISSQQQQSFLQSFLSWHSPQHAVWIGLHDTRIEGAFEWTAGTSVSYTNWIPGHQSNFESFRTEDCVAFIPYKNGKWDDIPCGNNYDLGKTHPILCQYKIPLSPGLIG